MDFVEAFYRAYYTDNQFYFEEFRAEKYGLTEANYWEQSMAQSEVKKADFDSIEAKLKRRLPDSLKEFYSRYYSFEKQFDLGGISIIGNQRENNLTSLQELIFDMGLSEDLLALDLVPFGMYQDEWFICLDYGADAIDPPIVLFESSTYFNGMKAKSHRIWFSNFEKFISSMTVYLQARISEAAANEEEDLDLDLDVVDQAIKLVDPSSNFRKAYDYWP